MGNDHLNFSDFGDPQKVKSLDDRYLKILGLLDLLHEQVDARDISAFTNEYIEQSSRLLDSLASVVKSTQYASLIEQHNNYVYKMKSVMTEGTILDNKRLFIKTLTRWWQTKLVLFEILEVKGKNGQASKK